jgi:hypothetical protein
VLRKNSGDKTAAVNEQPITVGMVADETPAVWLGDNPAPASSETTNGPVY